MLQTAFKTNPVALGELLRDCGKGKIQLPDFQRSWVWDEDRIIGLIASISQALPVGALMTLEMKAGAAESFARRPVQGAAPEADKQYPDQLLLDGQQRMTSLYQTCMRKEVVQTITARQKMVRRWFYIDIVKALRADVDRIDAIVAVPEDRRITRNFKKDVILDLSTREAEFEHMMFPLNMVFDVNAWQMEFYNYCFQRHDKARVDQFNEFMSKVLANFTGYHVPVIALSHDTTHEAVCLVFEKVNTGGKPLDAFELVTAMYAGRGFRLRDDWLGTAEKEGLQSRLQTFGRASEQRFGVLERISSTDVLQAIALLHTKAEREKKIAEGAKDNEVPAIRATRQSLLDLPLEAYLAYREPIEAGFKAAVKFLRQQNIYRVIDLPYQSQIVPLAAILTEIGDLWEHTAVKEKLARWYWCGIFGELYGSAAETRFARDIQEVPAWLRGGPEPATVKDGVFRSDRLKTMRTRLSAAYKGIHALLMREGAKDFRSGQDFGQTVFFDESVDIHHIFPEAWCRKHDIDKTEYDTIINKTPLSYRTNRIIGGAAPSEYLGRLEKGRPGDPPIAAPVLDGYLRSHCINPDLLRADQFKAFMADREKQLLTLIARVTGHQLLGAEEASDEGEDAPDDILQDSGLLADVAE
ncbi:GmrSD restriction endonuclease domain-containing protein [Caenispirillum bisanense]|uniref:GmrSD restriction endonuclease domain-containing protein n=1 Tax=Caenispirillum bisanense TaxID=414052 RepID=UPI0031D34F90